jgi:hypothetical protein
MHAAQSGDEATVLQNLVVETDWETRGRVLNSTKVVPYDSAKVVSRVPMVALGSEGLDSRFRYLVCRSQG